MSRDAADPAGLGRGRLTRWLPVLWQAPAVPPRTPPFELREGTTARRFLLRVMFSANRFTLAAVACFVAAQIGESLVPVVMGVAIDRALARGDVAQLVLWLAVLAGVFLVVSASRTSWSWRASSGCSIACAPRSPPACSIPRPVTAARPTAGSSPS
jgi:hypothetical protein